MSETKQYAARDQYGQYEWGLGAHPRKALLERCDRKRASCIYCDTKDGKVIRVGWVIAGRWFDVFAVEPMRVETPFVSARTAPDAVERGTP